MRQASLDFLKQLADAPSPSGYEQPAARIYRAYTEPFADTVSTDVHGQGFLSDLPLVSLSDDERTQIDNHLMMEDVAKAEGVSVDQLLDTWETEAATAKCLARSKR